MSEPYAHIRKVEVPMGGYNVYVYDDRYQQRAGWTVSRMGANLLARYLLRSYERAREKAQHAPVQWTVRLSDTKKEED